jgi:hypothetical protein
MVTGPARGRAVRIRSILLGSGEHLMTGLDLPALGYACTQHVASGKATHVVVTRRTSP